MTFHSRSRSSKSLYLNDFLTRAKVSRHILSLHISDLDIIRTDECRILVPCHISVDNDYRYSCIKSLIDCRSHLSCLIRRYNKKIDLLVNEICNVFLLLAAVIICGAYLQSYLMAKHRLSLHFRIHLFSPLILTALRYTYMKYFIIPISA